MSSLPVAAVLPELLTALDCAPQVLLSAPTGAGKSTWLPLQLLAHPGINGKIILLEPRRLAARNVAQRHRQNADARAAVNNGVQPETSALLR